MKSTLSSTLLSLLLLNRGDAFSLPVHSRSSSDRELRTRRYVATNSFLPNQRLASADADADGKRVGWHRRVLRRVLGKQEGLQMQSAAASLDAYQKQLIPDFLLQSFEAEEQIFANQNWPSLEVIESVEELRGTQERTSSILHRVTAAWFQKTLTNLLDRWSRGAHVNLQVACDPALGLDILLRGHFRCNARVVFDRVVFGNIRMSGGQLRANRLALNLWSFKRLQQKRYPEAFDFYADNVRFTEEDLFESSCIRNGLRRLLTTILQNRGMKTVSISSIRISNNKLCIQGEATTSFGAPVPFEVRSGLRVRSRGHILTFPGLELSLSPNIGFFVPVHPSVSVDLGHNAAIQHLSLADNMLQMSARVTITPEHTLRVFPYQQQKASYGALCSVDVGRWLTRIGNFSR